INYAWARNVVIVAAAGNNGLSDVGAPANCSHVISVAATDSADARASFSTWGAGVSVAAPGVGIYSTNFVGDYEAMSGTSMAAPFVSGLAGLIWATQYGTSNESVADRLLNTADQVPGTGTYWSHGRINAAAAVAAPAPTVTLSVAKAGT